MNLPIHEGLPSDTGHAGHRAPRLPPTETAFRYESNWKGTQPLIHTKVSMTKGGITTQSFR